MYKALYCATGKVAQWVILFSHYHVAIENEMVQMLKAQLSDMQLQGDYMFRV